MSTKGNVYKRQRTYGVNALVLILFLGATLIQSAPGSMSGLPGGSITSTPTSSSVAKVLFQTPLSQADASNPNLSGTATTSTPAKPCSFAGQAESSGSIAAIMCNFNNQSGAAETSKPLSFATPSSAVSANAAVPPPGSSKISTGIFGIAVGGAKTQQQGNVNPTPYGNL